MFASRPVFACLLALSSVMFAVASSPGDIVAPAANATISPGQAFSFSYNTHADYSITSYNYTVWLSSTIPSSYTRAVDLFSGHYFGRFSEPNYPGNPSPSNPPPSELVMPNFAKGPGGFGAGETASNVPFYLVVLEEWSDGTPTLGVKFSLNYNRILYNATSASL